MKMNFRNTSFALALSTGLVASLPAVASTTHTGPAPAVWSSNITEADVIAAQRAWGDALVAIATDYEQGGFKKAKATAEKVLDTAYGYSLGPVLFKPTLTKAPQTFRTTREGALAYFVGGNPNYPSDTGFALKGWRSAEIQNVAIKLSGDVALSQGNVILKDKNGKVTTVDKTWGYKRDDKGRLLIVLHHSSLPIAP